MSNLLLPVLPGMSFPVLKTPMWKGIVQEATSGRETRIGLWSFPRWKWSLPYEFLRNRDITDELWQLMGFFNEHQGTTQSWLFSDPDDNTATLEAFGVGDGASTQFQLARSRGGFVEPVQSLTLTGFKVFKDGVEQKNLAPPTPPKWSLDTSTGIITFTTAPGAGAVLTWSGTFYWRCRFAADTQEFSKFVSLIWELKKLEFMSVKL